MLSKYSSHDIQLSHINCTFLYQLSVLDGTLSPLRLCKRGKPIQYMFRGLTFWLMPYCYSAVVAPTQAKTLGRSHTWTPSTLTLLPGHPPDSPPIHLKIGKEHPYFRKFLDKLPYWLTMVEPSGVKKLPQSIAPRLTKLHGVHVVCYYHSLSNAYYFTLANASYLNLTIGYLTFKKNHSNKHSQCK